MSEQKDRRNAVIVAQIVLDCIEDVGYSIRACNIMTDDGSSFRDKICDQSIDLRFEWRIVCLIDDEDHSRAEACGRLCDSRSEEALPCVCRIRACRIDNA